ncbi:hypothetical protein Mal4_53640 [Maioricimonas rarisocia]|uniref:Uncharacterized protein n=1 Tax=Maioricimonas rarisocia TaxID=2528026 RepID=A0A517ZEY5_9PLAN|nr:hypothetical protein Mal4_53640 [Maioricimonas rarisocia]
MGSLQRNPNVARRVSFRAGRNACPTWSNEVGGLNNVPVPQRRLGLVPALPHDVRHAHHSAAFGCGLCHACLLPQESPGETSRSVSIRAGRNACPTWSNEVGRLNNVPVPQRRLGLVPALPHDVRHAHHSAAFGCGLCHACLLPQESPGETSRSVSIRAGRNACPTWSSCRRAGFIRPNRLADDHLWGALSVNSEIHSGR